MVRKFSRTNSIAHLPAAVVNYILSMAWVDELLASFGVGRRRLIFIDSDDMDFFYSFFRDT